MKMDNMARFAAAVAVALCAAAYGDALTLTWNGGSTGNFSDATWSGGAEGHASPQDGDTLVFETGGTFANDIAGLSVEKLEFRSADAVTLSGSQIAVANGGSITNTGVGVVTFNAPLSLGTAATPAIRIGVANGSTVTFNACISGAANIIYCDNGTVNLNVDNDYTGRTTINKGLIHVYANDAFGTTASYTEIKLAERYPSILNHVYFHGVTTGESFTNNTYVQTGSIIFPQGTTNVFNGSFAFSGLARPSIRGTTIFAGGLSHTSGYRLITANGYSGTFIVTNVAANVTVGLQSDASTLWRLYEPNNDFGTYGVFLNAGAVSCETGFALNSDTMPFGLNWSTSLRLNGHDQRIGSLYFGSSANTDSHVSSSSGPATLYFKQARVATNSATRIYGEVSLVKAGASEFAVNRAVEATGALAVVEGPFAFTPAGSWANATNVAVRGTGRLSLASSAAFNRKVRVDIADSGRIVLADGVAQRVGSLYINGVRKFGGTWGSSASQAKNKDDAHFSGAGVLSVAGGYIMIVR